MRLWSRPMRSSEPEGLDSRLEKRGLVISLPQAILFPSGRRPCRRLPRFPSFRKLPRCWRASRTKSRWSDMPIPSPSTTNASSSNWELSAARSVNLLEVLSTRYGISESRLSVQSYGSNDPKDSNDTEAGRAENRRVEILLLDESAPVESLRVPISATLGI